MISKLLNIPLDIQIYPPCNAQLNGQEPGNCSRNMDFTVASHCSSGDTVAISYSFNHTPQSGPRQQIWHNEKTDLSSLIAVTLQKIFHQYAQQNTCMIFSQYQIHWVFHHLKWRHTKELRSPVANVETLSQSSKKSNKQIMDA